VVVFVVPHSKQIHLFAEQQHMRAIFSENFIMLPFIKPV
jgi:hypothetical protein